MGRRDLHLAEERRNHRHALMRRAAILALLFVTCNGEHHHQRKAREAALVHDLLEMRKAIADFRNDKQRGPHSLSELKAAHYLRDIPADPITGSRMWRVTTEEAVRNDDFVSGTAPKPEAEVVDVHSRAVGRDAKGKLYAEY
jgi:general secretion pathway protein G